MICDSLNRLQELLQEQLVLVRQDRLAAAVALFDETDRCVRQVAATGGLEVRGTAESWQDIERLYQQLSLALAARRAEASAALKALGQGRRILKAYSRTGPSGR